jgi:hypothetical protein
MGFVAGVEEFALAVGRNGEDLSFIASGDEERAVGSKGEIPDVFGLGIEEDGLFASGGDAIDLAVGRRGYVERAFGVEGDGLGDEIGGFKNRDWLARAIAIKAEDFWASRPPRRVRLSGRRAETRDRRRLRRRRA